MSKLMEYRIKEEKLRFAAKLLQMGKATIEEIAELTELSLEEVKEVQKQLKSAPT